MGVNYQNWVMGPSDLGKLVCFFSISVLNTTYFIEYKSRLFYIVYVKR